MIGLVNARGNPLKADIPREVFFAGQDSLDEDGAPWRRLKDVDR
jgi:hypothetical protein